eukprot:3935478-Rhodomonas_salina.4
MVPHMPQQMRCKKQDHYRISQRLRNTSCEIATMCTVPVLNIAWVFNSGSDLVLGVDSVVLVLLVVEVRDRHWRTAEPGRYLSTVNCIAHRPISAQVPHILLPHSIAPGNLHFLLLLLVLLLLLHLLNRCRGRDLMHSLLFSFLRSRRHHLPPETPEGLRSALLSSAQQRPTPWNVHQECGFPSLIWGYS